MSKNTAIRTQHLKYKVEDIVKYLQYYRDRAFHPTSKLERANAQGMFVHYSKELDKVEVKLLKERKSKRVKDLLSTIREQRLVLNVEENVKEWQLEEV